MKINLKSVYKILYIIGLILLFLSMFLDWYYVQVIDSQGKVYAFWSFNPLSEWHTISSSDQFLRPPDLLIPLIINIIFLITIPISAYSILFNDVEKKDDLEKLYPYSYVNFFLIVLNLYYIFAFPLFYLLPNDLYFPFMRIKNKDVNAIYIFYIGPGYILQLVSFFFIFPYAIFYYKTIEEFKIREHLPEKVIDEYVEHVQEFIDFDKLITQEELKIKFNDHPIQEEEIQLKKYQRSGN